MNPAVTNLVLVLASMQGSKYIPFEDPSVLLAVRVAYIVSNLLIFGIYFYIGTQIKSKKDLTTLKYIEAASPGSTEEPKLVTTTVMEYDNQQLQSAYKAQLTGVAMMGFMHLYLKYTNPLLLQSIMPLKSLYESNLTKVHILGHPAAGELKRPWKTGGGFMNMLGGASDSTKTDKASIEAAERAGRGGAKEE